MSTILNTNGTSVEVPEVHPAVAGNFYVVTADWNPQVTHALRDGATGVLRRAGIDKKRIKTLEVAGSVELVNAAATLLNRNQWLPGSGSAMATEAVVIIGCVIRGDTPHFDYVCQMAAQGTASLNARGQAPVIFGVLTVDNLRQALDRAGGTLGNKGEEAAVAAIEMANLHARVRLGQIESLLDRQ